MIFRGFTENKKAMDHAIHRLYFCINRYALLVKTSLVKAFDLRVMRVKVALLYLIEWLRKWLYYALSNLYLNVS